MKISEILQPKMPSAINPAETQAVVAQDIVSSNRSAIMDGVERILRRVRGKGLKQGFRCTSGPRAGRIVAQSSTCNARLNPGKGAKIAQKRLAKASATAIKARRTKGSGGASRRLKGIQISKGKGSAPIKKSHRLLKSKIVAPKKSKKK